MKTESDPKKRKTIKIDVEHSWRGQGHYENSTVKAAMLLAARAIAMGCEVESECTDENFLAFIEEQKEKAALDKKKLDKIEEEEKKIEDKEHAQRTHYQTTLSAGCDRVEELLGKIQAKIEQIKKQESTLPLPASVAEQNRILQVLLQELKDLHMEFTKQSVSVRTHIAHLQTEYGNRRRQDAYQELLELDHRALVCQAKAHELVGPPDANNVYPPNGFSQYMIDPSPRGGPRPARGSWDNFRLDFEDFANGFAQSHNDLQAKEAQLQAVVLSARP